MNSRIALITGANKGIGLETARQLALNHYCTVLIGARDQTKGEAAAGRLREEGLDARPLLLDVTDRSSIEKAVAAVEQEFGRLDILINNAGTMLDNPAAKVSEQTLEVWRKTFETNFFGVVAVTQAFLPLLLKSEAGRIVNVSSILGSISLHADPRSVIYDNKIPAYSCSKAALNAYAVQLAYELKSTSIKVNAAHPGWVKTELGGAEAPMEIVDGAKTSVALATLDADGASGSYQHMGKALPW